MMSHHITSGGTDALQMMRAQQAFRTRTAKPESQVLPGEMEAPVDEILLSGAAEESAPKAVPTAKNQPDPHQDMYREVQDIAGRLGYVGLSETAIHRAMVRGESLLADYRA